MTHHPGPELSKEAGAAASSSEISPRSTRHLVWRWRGWSVRWEKRAGLVRLVLLLVGAALVGYAVTLGDYPISLGQVLASLGGTADDPLAQYFVTDVRLPRIITALVVGAALGISGTIFQTISDNPLGSPDIIGFTTGAATGALVAIILVGASPHGVSLGAVLGGLGAALLIYLLAWRQGVNGFRLVLVGIGVSAALAAINTLLIVKASLDSAQQAEQWKAGSFNAASWSNLLWLAVAMVLLVPAILAVVRGLGMVPFGDDAATALGVRVERVRAAAMVVGVLLVALATATSGPIAFVALAAPHIARRISHTAGLAVVNSALMGAVLTLASDIIAQRAFAPTQLAVGVVTGSLGGCYLIVLLALEWRKTR